MSNPYLTRYNGTLKHAWTNKAKEKEYNHQYYLENKERILSRQRANSQSGSSPEYQAELAYNSRKNNGQMTTVTRKPQTEAVGPNDLSKMSKEYQAELAYNSRKNNGQMTTVTRKPQTEAVGPNDLSKMSKEYQAELAYNSRKNNGQMTTVTRKPQTEAVGPNDLSKMSKEYQAELAYNSRKNSYPEPATTVQNVAAKKKATSILDRAKNALEQAKIKYRAFKANGGIGGAVKRAYDRAKQLFQRAKDKLKELRNKSTGKNSSSGKTVYKGHENGAYHFTFE